MISDVLDDVGVRTHDSYSSTDQLFLSAQHTPHPTCSQKSTTMPPPSALSIKTSAVIRLIKEEASYHKEAVAQEKVIAKLEKEGGDEYELRQQVCLPR